MTPLDAVLDALSAANCSPRRLGAGWLAKCPVHDDRKPSLSVSAGEDGRVLVHCFAGCTAQAIAQALGLRVSDLFSTTAPPRRPAPRLPPAIPHIGPPDFPVIDQERALRLQEIGLTNILEGRADQWLSHRGISRDWIASTPLLGFVDRAAIRGWANPLTNAWIIRITDDEGRCVALKAHRESPPPGVPKACWLPFGTQPADHPRHGVNVFWPPPAWFPKRETLFLLEGELKAAAVLSAGLCATSPTAGAGLRWSPWCVECFRGRRVVVLYDSDSAGIAFHANAVAALRDAVPELRAAAYERKGAA